MKHNLVSDNALKSLFILGIIGFINFLCGTFTTNRWQFFASIFCLCISGMAYLWLKEHKNNGGDV
jgi:hypothetical protein